MLTLQNKIVWLRRVQWTMGAATLVIATGFYLCGYKPHMRRLADLQDQIEKYDSELIASRDQKQAMLIRPAMRDGAGDFLDQRRIGNVPGVGESCNPAHNYGSNCSGKTA